MSDVEMICKIDDLLNDPNLIDEHKAILLEAIEVGLSDRSA